jgi:hypothetical protein
VCVTATPFAKFAVTCTGVFPVRVHAPVPAQPLLQPEKVDPVVAAGVRVTTAPLANVSAQSVPQAIPAGLLVTVPAPVPAFVTVTLSPAGAGGVPQASLE